MSPTVTTTAMPVDAEVPGELLDLMARIRDLPPAARAAIEPFAAEALDQARFRTRVLSVARDALEQLRLDLELTRFDLDVTRREREALLRLVGELDGRGD